MHVTIRVKVILSHEMYALLLVRQIKLSLIYIYIYIYIGTGRDVRLKDGMVRHKNARTHMYRCTRSPDALQITSPDWLSS